MARIHFPPFCIDPCKEQIVLFRLTVSWLTFFPRLWRFTASFPHPNMPCLASLITGPEWTTCLIPTCDPPFIWLSQVMEWQHHRFEDLSLSNPGTLSLITQHQWSQWRRLAVTQVVVMQRNYSDLRPEIAMQTFCYCILWHLAFCVSLGVHSAGRVVLYDVGLVQGTCYVAKQVLTAPLGPRRCKTADREKRSWWKYNCCAWTFFKLPPWIPVWLSRRRVKLPLLNLHQQSSAEDYLSTRWGVF